MNDFIDPEELPFTTDEIFRAACRFLPMDTARLMANHLTDCGPDTIAMRAERRTAWAAADVPGAETRLLHGWTYPEELLPALASLSVEAEARARSLMEETWASHRRSAVPAAQLAAAEAAGLVPTREEIIRKLEGSMVSSAGRPPSGATLSIKLPPLAPPSSEMEATADLQITEKRRAWEAAVARFRDRAD